MTVADMRFLNGLTGLGHWISKKLGIVDFFFTYHGSVFRRDEESLKGIYGHLNLEHVKNEEVDMMKVGQFTHCDCLSIMI